MTFIPRAAIVGRAVRANLEALLAASPNLLKRCLGAIGSKIPGGGPTDAQLVIVRQAIFAAL
eukprot:16439560-Heterocapsa_arctica.AAC.1